MALAKRDSLDRHELKRVVPSATGRKRNYRILPRKKRSNIFFFSKCFILVTIVCIVAGIYLYKSTHEALLSFQLEDEQRKLNEVISDYERLYMELGQNGSVSSLEKRAAALGFRPAESNQYVRLAP